VTTGVVARRGVLAGVAALVVASAARTRVASAAGRVKPLGWFATAYETDLEHRPRGFNVELAASAIDATVIDPRAVFSFNGAVGARTAAFGFEKSVVLRDHLLVEGTGGGTCQVASTLHAAALLAGLDVVDRTPHSRPSAYIRMGLDATVTFGKIDLKVRNPGEDRVVLRAAAGHGRLDVWVDPIGSKRPRVSVTSEIIERTSYERTVERDARLQGDEVHVRAHGIPGYRVLRTRDLVTDDDVRREERMDLYAPTPEILAVGPAFDLARLDGASLPRPGRDLDAPADPLGRPVFVDDAAAHRPALMQTRPEDRVVFDNA